jgi:hypothetical protein
MEAADRPVFTGAAIEGILVEIVFGRAVLVGGSRRQQAHSN